MSDLTSPLGGDDLAKALSDAYGQGWRHAVIVEVQTKEVEGQREYEGKRDAWIRQYLARMPAAVPAGRDGEEVRGTERESEAPIYEAFARFVGSADDRSGDFRMFATGYHAAVQAQEPHPSPKVDAQVWAAARQLDAIQAAQPEWLWFADEKWLTTFGRRGTHSGQAPYIRADIAIAAAPVSSSGDGASTKAQWTILLHLAEAVDILADTDGADDPATGNYEFVVKMRRYLDEESQRLSAIDIGGSGELVLASGSGEETPDPSPQSSPTLKTGAMTVEEATLRKMHRDGIVAADWTQFTHEQSLALLTKYLPAALRTLQGEAAE